MNLLSSSNGFYYLVKGIVTRRPITSEINPNRSPDPLGFRMQVWIPAYHGGSQPDENMIYDTDENGNSTKSGFGKYPWAQICSINYANSVSTSTGLLGLMLKLMGNDQSVQPIILPEVDDAVWLAFEGGNVNSPIYVGDVINKQDLEELIGLKNGSGLMNGIGSVYDLIRPIIVFEETGLSI